MKGGLEMSHRSRSKYLIAKTCARLLVCLLIFSVVIPSSSLTSAEVLSSTPIANATTVIENGLMSLLMEGSNGLMDNSRTVTSAFEIYLPLVMRRYPPTPDTPVLNPINNPDGGKSYSVSWGIAYLANTYVLQEDDNVSFSNPTQRYSGSGTTWNATGKSPGTYYYRVKASNTWGDSTWSNIQKVKVLPPMAEVYVKNDTGGSLCYEVYDTGIGQKCFSSGTHYYGSFPSGTYKWRASAWCGTDSGSRYYGPEEYIHRFWCQ